MNDPATPSTAETAAAVLGTAPDLPRPTPGLPAPAASPAAAPAAPSPARPSDRKGTVHDPRIHEDPPRLNKEGLWARLRYPRKDVPPPETSGPPASDGPAAPSTPPPDDILAGPIRDGVPVAPEPPPMVALESYRSMATSITEGQFAVAVIGISKAWEPEREERKAWIDAWMRTLYHYQATPFGPILELIILACTSTAKRRHDPDTRAAFGGWWAWIKRAAFGDHAQPVGANSHDWKPVDDRRPPPPKPAAPAAPAAPDPYRLGAVSIPSDGGRPGVGYS